MLLLVVRAVGAAAHDQVAVLIPARLHDPRDALLRHAQEAVRVRRSADRVHRNLAVAARAVLEADRHAEAARQLAVHLALGGAGADGPPAHQVRDELRSDGIQELAARGQAALQHVQDDYNPVLLDFWMAIDESVEPGKSKQIVLGYEEYIGEIYKVQVEGYYKDLKNMLTFVETRASTDEVMSDEKLTDMFDISDGFAYGLEVFAQKMYGKIIFV